MKNTVTLSNGDTFRFVLNMGTLMKLEKIVGGSLEKGLKNSPINAIMGLIAFALVNVKTSKPMGTFAAEKLEIEDTVAAGEFVKEQIKTVKGINVKVVK